MDINVNVMQLNAKQVMGFIAFCSIEANGTVLPAGIVSRHLKSEKSRRFFKNRITENGMYFTLISDAISLAKKRYTSVYGSSVIPRHTGHNRSYDPSCVSPAAGCQAFLSGFDPDTCSKNDMKLMKKHCASVEYKLVHLCRETTREVVFGNKKKSPEDKKISPKDTMKTFLASVKEIAGKGCSDIFSLNFVQVAGYFGFIPIKMLAVSTIQNTTAGGYKFIEMLYPKIGTKLAQEFFEESTLIIQRIFGPSMTFAYAENLLCELFRDRNGSNTKKDVTFFFNHRNNSWRGLQNFFRLKIESCNKMDLEMLPVPATNDQSGSSSTKTVPPGCIKLMTWKDGLTAGCGSMKWNHDTKITKERNQKYRQKLITYDSKLEIHEDISRFYVLDNKKANRGTWSESS
jgi:hypothetical protein